MQYRVKTDEELTREFGPNWRNVKDLFWYDGNDKFLGTVFETKDETIKVTGRENIPYVVGEDTPLGRVGGIVLAVLEEYSDIEF